MNIVLKWNFKTLLADVPRLLLTLLNIAAAGAMFTGMGLMLDSFAAATGSINHGIMYYVVNVALPVVILLSYAVTTYVLFSVTLAERKSQYRLLRTAGCTTRQLLWSLTYEALALNVAGLLPGVGIGYLLARRQLRGLGIPMAPEALFGGTVWRGLCAMFLLTVALMLLASLPLWLIRREQRRKKPPKKIREPFKTRPLPRIFGAGGRLEYALGKNERRHRAAVTMSVVVNLAVLFLMATGLSVLSQSAVTLPQEDGEDAIVSLEFYLPSLSDERKSSTEALLRRLEQEGLCGSFSYHAFWDSYYLYVSVKEEDVCLTVPATDDPAISVPNPELFRLRDGRYVMPLVLEIIDDAAYGTLAEALGVPDTGTGGMLVNQSEDSYLDETSGERFSVDCTLLKKLPELPFTLRHLPDEWIPLVAQTAGKRVYTLPDGAEKLPEPEKAAAVRIDGLINGKDLLANGHGYAFPSLILPERFFIASEEASSIDDGYFYLGYSILTEDPALLSETLTAAFREDGLTVLTQRFNDGGEANTETLQQFYAESDRFDKILLTDDTSNQRQYETFLRLAERSFGYFAVMIFLSIGLNIVNIVHVNRLSRRREYAILTSIGLSGRQRLGMQLYESFRFTVRAVLSAIPTLVVIAVAIFPSALDAYEGEDLRQQIQWAYDGGYMRDASLWKQWYTVAVNLAAVLKPYWTLALFAVLFLFAGYVVTEYLVNRRMDRDELIPILKDEMYE